MPRPKAFTPAQALEHAAVVFWAKGYEATSIQDLTDAMGINRGSLYATFGDKEALFLAVLDWYTTRHAAEMAPRQQAETDGLAAIAADLRMMAEHLAQSDRPTGCLLVDSALGCAHLPRLAEFVERHVAQMEDRFYQAFRHAQRADELDPAADPRAWARFLTAAVHGMAVRGKLNRDPVALHDIATTTLHSLPRPPH